MQSLLKSIRFHQQPLYSPLNPRTYSALDYVQTLTRNLTNNVENFHKALGIRREDAFSTNMLTQVIEQLMNSLAPFPGFHHTTPRFPSLLISPKSPSSSRECSAIVEDDSISMDQTM